MMNAACPMDNAQPAMLTQRIEAAFGTIAQTRMHDMPLNNPRLQVAMVGLRMWQSSWIGVLVTPWSINLLQLPMPDAPFPPARADEVIDVALPGAVMPFIPARLEALGAYRMCSLFSPPQQFADQATAVAMAQETLRLLFEPDAQDVPDAPDTSRQAQEPAGTRAMPSSSASSGAQNPSRRRLFGLRT
jgi:[NiFe] hydrogenase assembly HybE family chaperone